MKKLLLLICVLISLVSVVNATTNDAFLYVSMDRSNNSGFTMGDQSGNGHDGTAQLPATVKLNQAGVLNDSIQFVDTSNPSDRIEYGNGELEMYDKDFTLSYWAKTTGTGNDRYTFSTIDEAGAADYYIHMGFQGGGLRFYEGQSGAGIHSWIYDNTSFAPNDGNWHHIVLTFDWNSGTNAVSTVRVDDTHYYTFTASYTTGRTDDDPYCIGAYCKDDGYRGLSFDGNIDEFAIYKRILTADERSALYNSGDGYNPYSGAPAPTAPVVSNTWGTPNATTNYVNTNITFDWGNCTGGAGTGVYNYSFYLNDTLQYFGTSSNWTSGFTLQQNYTYNYYCSDANNLSSANSTQRWVIYDYATPEISNVVKPTTTINVIDYFNFTLTDNIGLYQYEINLTYASNGTQINYTKDTTLSGKEANISYVLNHTNIPFAKLNVKLNYSDTSTDSIFNGLDWSYSNGEITFYNPDDEAENIILDFGYYSNNEVHRLTTTQIQNYNVQKVINKKRDRFEFGAVFDLPNTDFIFGFRIPKKSDMNLYSEEDLHFIMYDKYWMDFDTYIGKNGIYKKFNASMKQDDNYYYVYYNINWEAYNVEAGDRITFITKSIGGLNFNSYTFDYYYVDTPIPVFQYGKLNSFSSSDINWTIDLLILNNKTSSLTINITPDPNLGSMFQTTIAAYGYYKKTYYNITSLTSANTWLNFTGFNVNHTFGGLITTSDALSLITPSNGTGSGSGLISCISTIGAGCGVSFTDDCAVIS